MTYRIMGRYAGETEEIDEAEDAETAGVLVAEYACAFGEGWRVWCPELDREAEPEPRPRWRYGGGHYPGVFGEVAP